MRRKSYKAKTRIHTTKPVAKEKTRLQCCLVAAYFGFYSGYDILLHLGDAEGCYSVHVAFGFGYPIIFCQFAETGAGYFAAFTQLFLQLFFGKYIAV